MGEAGLDHPGHRRAIRKNDHPRQLRLVGGTQAGLEKVTKPGKGKEGGQGDDGTLGGEVVTDTRIGDMRKKNEWVTALRKKK